MDRLKSDCQVVEQMTTSFQPIRLAIVGCGLITEDFHLPAALCSPLVKLAALVDNNLERASLLSRKYGCDASIHTRLEDIISDVDGVLIATPNFTHGPIARVALEKGVPALIEKPLTTSYAEAIELCELAEANRTFISVGYFSRHSPVVPLFKRLLEEGVFGSLKSFHFESGTAGGWTPLSGYNLDRRLAGGGVLVVRGTHFLDRMLYWFGMPKSFLFADDNYDGVEANCKAQMEFEGKFGRFSGSVFFSKTIDLKNKLVVESDLYRIEIPESETEELTLYSHSLPGVRIAMRADRGANAAHVTAPDCFQNQIDDFARAIREKTRPLVDGREGALSVKLLEDFYAHRSQLPEPWRWYGEQTMSVSK
jgi:predicted dehydrogenase